MGAWNEGGDDGAPASPVEAPGAGASTGAEDPGRGTVRMLAGVAGAGFALAALVAAGFMVISWWIAARVPNAHDVVGEVASTPDTWSETFELVGIATMIALLTGVCAVAAVGLLGVSLRNRRPGRRTLLAVGLGPAVVSLAVMGTALAVDSGNAVPATNCDEFRVDSADFSSTEADRWDRQARGLASCLVLIDRTSAQVRRMLGEPAPTVTKYGDFSYHEGRLVVYFDDDGVVVDVAYSPSVG